MNMEEETKYDFSSYLLDKSKGFGRSNTIKGTSGRTGHSTKKSGFAGISGQSAGGSNASAAMKAGLIGGGKPTTATGTDKTPTKRVKNGVTKR
jgi:hypothetical protein